VFRHVSFCLVSRLRRESIKFIGKGVPSLPKPNPCKFEASCKSRSFTQLLQTTTTGLDLSLFLVARFARCDFKTRSRAAPSPPLGRGRIIPASFACYRLIPSVQTVRGLCCVNTVLSLFCPASTRESSVSVRRSTAASGPRCPPCSSPRAGCGAASRPAAPCSRRLR